MEARCRLAVVIPVGPGERLEDVADTVASVRHYCRSGTRILLLDQAGGRAVARLAARDLGLEAVNFTSRKGVLGPLTYGLSRAFMHLYETSDWDLVLKLDVDALVTGPTPEDDALRLMSRVPGASMGGAYRYSSAGWFRETWQCCPYLPQYDSWRSLRRGADRFVRRAVRSGLRNGWDPGEHCQGGAYFITRAAVADWIRLGFLGSRHLLAVPCGEDSTFGMLSRAAGRTMVELSLAGGPVSTAAQGLEMSPEEITARGKKLVHSVRRWNGMDGSTIRAYFRARRGSATGSGATQRSSGHTSDPRPR